MGILSDARIIEELEKGNIKITPYDRRNLGPNSYDLTLSENLLVYQEPHGLDCKKEHKTKEIIIPEEGIELRPGFLYLACTNEYTETKEQYIPMLEGKSSLGRLGIAVHITAGFGDAGYAGYWTLEIFVLQPTRVYANMKIAQIYYHTVEGIVIQNYKLRPESKYNNNEPKPIPSQMFKNFPEYKEKLKNRFLDSGIAGEPKEDV